MASAQWGRNGGITGIIDFSTATGASVQFHGKFYAYKTKLQGNTKTRRGRGSTVFDTLRYISTGGNLLFIGKPSTDQYPAPGTFKGAVGTATLTINTGRTVAYPLTVLAIDWDFDERKEDSPWYTIAASPTAAPTYTGWHGTQPTESTASKTDQEQYAGTSKTKDTGNLQSSAERVTDIWGTLGDTDSAEYTKLGAVISAATVPFSGMKLRSATFLRDAVDGGTVREIWGLTTSDEDVINANTALTTDTNKLATSGTTAAINNTAPTLHTAAGQTIKRRTTMNRELNDSNTLYVSAEGLTTTDEDVENQGTSLTIDTNKLGTRGTVASFNNTAPTLHTATGQTIKRRTTTQQEHNDSMTLYTSEEGLTTTEEDVLNEANRVNLDPSGLESNANQAAFNATPSAPTTAPFSGGTWKTRNQTSREFNDSMTLNTYTFGERTTQEDIERPGTFAVTDPSDIGSTGQQTNVILAGGTTPTLNAASGQQLVATRTSAHDAGHTVIDQITGKDTEKQKWEQEHSFTESDTFSITNSASVGALDAIGSAPSGNFVLRTTRVESVTHDHTGGITLYGTLTPSQEISIPGTLAFTDPLGIESNSIVTTPYYTAASVPGDPSPPAGTQIVGATVQLHNNFVSKKKWEMGVLNSEQKREFPATVFYVDPQGIDSYEVQADHSGTGTPTFTASGDLKIVGTSTAPVTPGGKKFVTAKYGTRNSRDELVIPHLWDRLDPSTIPTENEAERSCLDGESITAPTWTGQTLVSSQTNAVTTGLSTVRSQTTNRYGYVTPQTAAEFARTKGTRDPLSGMKDETTARVSSTQPTASAYAGLSLTTNQTIPSYAGSVVTPLRSGVYEETLLYDFEDKKLHSANNHVVREAVRGVPSGGITGSTLTPGGVSTSDVNAWVRVYFNFGDLQARPIFIWRAVGSFMLRRVFNLNQTDLFTKLYLAVKGKISNASFLGYDTGEVMYVGPAAVYIFSIAGQKRAVIDYEMETDNWKFFNDGYLSSGSVAVNSGSITSSGFYTSAILEDGYGVTFPEQADFSGFLGP